MNLTSEPTTGEESSTYDFPVGMKLLRKLVFSYPWCEFVPIETVQYHRKNVFFKYFDGIELMYQHFTKKHNTHNTFSFFSICIL